ncbi:hypothetical protein P5V15_011323 [Pogonomyrmex californicus]
MRGAESLDWDEVGKRITGNIHRDGIGYFVFGDLVPKLLVGFKFSLDEEGARRWMGGRARKLTNEVKKLLHVEVFWSTLVLEFGRGTEGGGVLMQRNVG